MRSIVLVVALLFVAACAASREKVWTKEGLTQQTLAQDRYECLGQAPPAKGFVFGPMWYVLSQQDKLKDERREMYRACMEANGYRIEKVPDAEAPRWQRVDRD